MLFTNGDQFNELSVVISLFDMISLAKSVKNVQDQQLYPCRREDTDIDSDAHCQGDLPEKSFTEGFSFVYSCVGITLQCSMTEGEICKETPSQRFIVTQVISILNR